MNSYINYPTYQQNGDRIFPFLVGALAGGAVVGLSRPRPIVAYPYPAYPPFGYPYGYGYRPFY